VANEVGQKDPPPLQNTNEMRRAAPKVSGDLGPQFSNAASDLLRWKQNLKIFFGGHFTYHEVSVDGQVGVC